MAQHRNWHSTALCDCPWDKGAVSLTKEAGKLHDFLMNPKNRPDLQTPEAQEFLSKLEQHYYQPDANGNSKTDALMPWLTREWKKKRVGFRPADAYQSTDPYLWHLGTEGQPITPFTPAHVSHIADWYGSNAPNRRGHDLMQSTAWDVHNQKIPEWESWMAEEAKRKDFESAKSLGKVLHKFDDDWTVRQLPAEALQYEGWAMRGKPAYQGHDGYPICVGEPQYQHQVREGDTAILSLRDPTGQPHVTAEVTPYSGMGERDHGSWDWPTFDKDLEEWPFSKNTGDDFKRRLREIHDEHLQTPSNFLRYDYDTKGTQPGEPTPPEGDPHSVYAKMRERYGTWIPGIEKGVIEQIQGKGNTVPKDEYQDRMKQFFQTFPEHERPNWDYASQGDQITHIGALVPDAESYSPDHGGTIVGDPDEGGGDLDMGGYHPHGDYGLAPRPERGIHYNSVLHSLVRPRSYYEVREGDLKYHENEGHALYEEAKRRGEIPKLAHDLEGYNQTAMNRYDEHREMNYDYYPPYPGDSWDEEPERWQYDENGQQRTPEEMEEAHRGAYQAYEDGEDEAIQRVPEMQVVNHMYKMLNPHYDYGEQGYVNTPSPQPPQQNVAKVAAPKPYSNKDVKPLYYRWVYSPANGNVDLAHNWRDHPSEIGYHAQMAADRNEPGLVHGYAYRIHGGWRLTDWDHRPVADPYVVARVIRSLRHREGVKQAPVRPDEPQKTSGLDWDRLHWGLPLPIVSD